MILYHFFYIILIFFCTPEHAVSMCVINVSQPQDYLHLHVRFNQSVSISCHVNTSCPALGYDVHWYVFRTDSFNLLDINTPPLKYQLQGDNLSINWLSESDDGVYHCAASHYNSANSGAQAIGTGTTLTLKENHFNSGHIVLFTLAGLLSLYCLLILALFICIKTGHFLLLKGRRSQSQGKSDSTRRVGFGAVVQELYSKRNLRRSKKNKLTEVSQENKVENPQTHTVREDIYQNFKMTR